MKTTMDAEKVNRFGTVDYVLFAVMLLLSSLIGLYYACTGGRQRTAGEYLLGNRRMTVLPIAFSLFATFMSSVALLSVPIEVYSFGTQFTLITLGFTLMVPITCYFYIPVFYNLEITSVNEYLERRFNKTVRKFGAFVFIIQMVLYLSVVIYGPSLALSQVTGIDVWFCVIVTLAVCSLYTIIGGLKGVMWTDVLQTCFMFIALTTILVMGCIHVGGYEKIIKINTEGRRFQFFNLSLHPHERYTFWTQVIGGTFTWTGIFAVSQMQVQRYLAAESIKVARVALCWSLLGLWLGNTIPYLLGLTMYAYYSTCDPVLSHQAKNSDQIVPHFAVIVLKDLPGFLGLFVAGVLSASLSTLSSGLNALAAITLEDFVLSIPRCRNMNENRAAVVAKVIAFAYGVLCLLCVIVVEKFDSLIQGCFLLFGMIGGPIFGLFSLGIMFPWANSWGAGVGVIVGLTTTLWMGIGSLLYKSPTVKLPLTTSGCVPNQTIFIQLQNSTTTLSTIISKENTSFFSFVYDISFMWYSVIAFCTVIIVGLIVSFLTGANKPGDVDPRLLSQFVRKSFHNAPITYSRGEQLPAIANSQSGNKDNETVFELEKLRRQH